MKKVEYLSPTSLKLFYDNQQEFYLMYMSDKRPDKFPQTDPMAAGSAFDAYAKSWLHGRLFGDGHDPRFQLEAIFESQVEPQNRDKAREAGEHLFEVYKRSGALADLMLDLQKAVGEPRFEFKVQGVIGGFREGFSRTTLDVPLLGKPDIFYINALGARVVFDWKVSGYYGARTTSPMQGYVRLRENGANKGQHKDCQMMSVGGVMINIGQYLNDLNEDWGRQLAIYGWLCGEDIGDDFIVAIDQLACKSVGMDRPGVRVAEHRLRIHKDYQWRMFSQAQQAWEIIHSDHFFRDVSKEESQSRCKVLDGVADALKGDGSEADRWFNSATRGTEFKPF